MALDHVQRKESGPGADTAGVRAGNAPQPTRSSLRGMSYAQQVARLSPASGGAPGHTPVQLEEDPYADLDTADATGAGQLPPAPLGAEQPATGREEAGADARVGKKATLKRRLFHKKLGEKSVGKVSIEAAGFAEAEVTYTAADGAGSDVTGGWMDGLGTKVETELFSADSGSWYDVKSVKWENEARVPVKDKAAEDSWVEVGTKLVLETHGGQAAEIGVTLISVEKTSDGWQVNAVAGTGAIKQDFAFDPASIVGCPPKVLEIKVSGGVELSVQPDWKRIIAEKIAQAVGEHAITTGGVALLEAAAALAPIAFIAASAYALYDLERLINNVEDVESGRAEQTLRSWMREGFFMGIRNQPPPADGGRVAALANGKGKEWRSYLHEKYKNHPEIKKWREQAIADGSSPGMLDAQLEHQFGIELGRIEHDLAKQALSGATPLVRAQVFEAFCKKEGDPKFQFRVFSHLFGPKFRPGDNIQDYPYPNAPDGVYENMRSRMPGMLPQRGKRPAAAAKKKRTPEDEARAKRWASSAAERTWVMSYVTQHPFAMASDVRIAYGQAHDEAELKVSDATLELWIQEAKEAVEAIPEEDFDISTNDDPPTEADEADDFVGRWKRAHPAAGATAKTPAPEAEPAIDVSTRIQAIEASLNAASRGTVAWNAEVKGNQLHRCLQDRHIGSARVAHSAGQAQYNQARGLVAKAKALPMGQRRLDAAQAAQTAYGGAYAHFLVGLEKYGRV